MPAAVRGAEPQLSMGALCLSVCGDKVLFKTHFENEMNLQ
jgi:hypothetical protein